MVYADFEYYSGLFFGDTISETDYEKYAARATREIDRLTMGRAAGAGDAMRPGLAACCCEMAEILYRADEDDRRTGHGLIASESNDGLSVTFTGTGDTVKRTAARLFAAAQRWLCAPVNLLYPGV